MNTTTNISVVGGPSTSASAARFWDGFWGRALEGQRGANPRQQGARPHVSQPPFPPTPGSQLQPNTLQSCVPRVKRATLLTAGRADGSCEINPASIISRRLLARKGKKWKQILHDTFIFVIYLLAQSKSPAALHYGDYANEGHRDN